MLSLLRKNRKKKKRMMKMVKIELERKASIDDKNQIRIVSAVKEDLNAGEYREMYGRKSKELMELREAIRQGTEQLKEIQAIEETTELKDFVEKLNKAEKLKKKVELIMNLRKFEVDVQRMQKELDSLTPVMIKINTEKL
jgi:hypothetical protein